MDFLNIPIFSLMKANMMYLTEQQSAVTQNIANADTPGFKALEVKKPDFKKMAASTSGGKGGQLTMTLTNPKHMTGTAANNGMFKMEHRKNTDELNPDGNNVDIEEEMSKMADTQMSYQKVVSLYGKTVSMFKTAIGNTSGG